MVASAQEQQIVQGQAATLVSYPPRLAKASAATARVSTPSLDMPAVGVAATVDSLSATTVQTALRGSTTLLLSAAASFVRGRQYVVIDAITGARVVIESTATGSTDTVKLASPLPIDIEGGSSVVGYACTFALTSGEVGTEIGRCVVAWEATIDGEAIAWAQDARVVRRLVNHAITATDIEKWSPYAVQLKPNGDDDWTETIGAAWARYMLPALLAKGVQPERIVSWEVLTPWHIAAIEMHIATVTPEPDINVRAEKKAALVEARDLALQSMRFWVDSADDLSKPQDSTEPQPWAITYVSR
jgi:hypothetical protein